MDFFGKNNVKAPKLPFFGYYGFFLLLKSLHMEKTSTWKNQIK